MKDLDQLARPKPLQAIFCSAKVYESLRTVAAVMWQHTGSDYLRGVPVYIDPEMPDDHVDYAHDQLAVVTRLARIKIREMWPNQPSADKPKAKRVRRAP
jgi:hypothetical protein